MIPNLFLGPAFGWETEGRNKVAISQLRERDPFYSHRCPKAQLIKNKSYQSMNNTTKILGYIPVINVIVGIIILTQIKNLDPKYQDTWRARGIAVIFAGPLLFVVDMIKFISDVKIVAKYEQQFPDLIKEFNTTHDHTPSYWPGHPVDCTYDVIKG